MCQMLFTWSTENLCIIFRQWRVSGPITLVLSLLGVAILTAGYEAVRQIGRNYEKAHAARIDAIGSRSSKFTSCVFFLSSLLSHLLRSRGPPRERNELTTFRGQGEQEIGKETRYHHQGGFVLPPGLLQLLHYVRFKLQGLPGYLLTCGTGCCS